MPINKSGAKAGEAAIRSPSVSQLTMVAAVAYLVGRLVFGGVRVSPSEPVCDQSSQQGPAGNSSESVVSSSVDQLLKKYPAELTGLAFIEGQEELNPLLLKVGERVDAFFRNFPNTTSRENVLIERLKANGKAEASLSRNYDYMVQAYPDHAGIGLEEDRIDSQGSPGGHVSMIGYCLTSGYTGTPILFLPRRQSASAYRYLGRQSVEPHAHVIAFAQKPEEGNAIGAFRTDSRSTSTPMFYQGLAWVDPRTFQIVRMRTDLLTPLTDIQLSAHTTEVLFGEVRFNSVAQAFWLPQRVTVTICWKGKTYRNLHRYSDYKLFSVRSFDKVEPPKARKRG